jgi:hypothetical protein
MERYQNYLFRIRCAGISEDPNKHCKDDDDAMELARKYAKLYPKGTTIKVYHIADVDGRETKNYIGTAEH